jgi:aryl-alcohol dehydrogenase-like predicted oxidoreductase
MADELAATPAQFALAWLLQRSPAVLPIPGTSTVAHSKRTWKLRRSSSPPNQVRQLDAVI